MLILSWIYGLLFVLGLGCMAMLVVFFVGMAMGNGNYPGYSPSKKDLLRDYQDKNVAFGGLLGIFKWLAIAGITSLALGSVFWTISKILA